MHVFRWFCILAGCLRYAVKIVRGGFANGCLFCSGCSYRYRCLTAKYYSGILNCFIGIKSYQCGNRDYADITSSNDVLAVCSSGTRW